MVVRGKLEVDQDFGCRGFCCEGVVIDGVEEFVVVMSIAPRRIRKSEWSLLDSGWDAGLDHDDQRGDFSLTVVVQAFFTF